MSKKIQTAGRVILAGVGILLPCSLFMAFGTAANPKIHAAIIAGFALIFALIEATLYGILKHGEDMQKTKALAARQYEILQDRIAQYRRFSLNIIGVNLALRITSGVVAAILAFQNVSAVEFSLCLIGYAAIGWSVSMFIYLFFAFRKISNFRAKLDAVNREGELSQAYAAKMRSSHP